MTASGTICQSSGFNGCLIHESSIKECRFSLKKKIVSIAIKSCESVSACVVL